MKGKHIIVGVSAGIAAYKAIEVMKKLNYIVDISQVNISKNRGQSYMMIANNPIYIVQCIRSLN